MKYTNIGTLKAVQNVPYCKASTDLKVGMGVTLSLTAKTAAKPADVTACKACHYIVSNIWDKPEQRTVAEANTVKAGEYVRADDLLFLNGLEIDFTSTEISTTFANVAVGDNLVFGTDGLLAEEATLTGYVVYFTVLDKTSYGGNGVHCQIHVQ